MLKKASKTTTLIVFFSFLASSIAFAKGYDDDRDGPRRQKKHHKRGMHFGNPERMKEKLDLTDEQIGKIKKINSEYKIKFENFRDKVKAEKKELRKLLKEENINLKKVKKQLEKIALTRAQIHFTKIKHRLAIEKVLTPEQVKKHRKELRKKRRQHKRRNDR